MTSEQKADGWRKRFHQRSKSSIGDYNLPIYLDPISNVVQMKETPNAGKKDHNHSWFKSKTPGKPNPDVASDLEVEDEKPLQQHRVVQGLYRDDDGGPSPKTLVTSLSAARDAVKEFAKDFVAQMYAGDPDETLAMESQMRQLLHLPSSSPPTVPSKFVVQAYIVHHFFSDFENASFGIPNPGEKPWEVQDHMHRCFAQFQKCRTKSQTVSTLLKTESKDSSELSFLSQFCVQKFRTIVPSEAFFGGDCRYHLDLEQGHHPDTPFYRSFLSAAVSVWLLQRLACSFEQKIVPIFPTRGDAFQRRFMAPVVPGVGDAEGEENDGNLEIAFTVFPGFRVSDSVVESLVYIVETPTVLLKTETPVSTYVTEPPIEKIQKSPVGGEHSLPLESSVFTVESPTEFPDTSTSSSLVEPRVETTQKSHKGGENRLLQKIRSKFIRKKTLMKGTVLAGSTATVTAAPLWSEQVSPRGEATPRLKESAPPTEEPAPRSEESAPSIGESAPRLEESTPSTREAAPRLEEPTLSRGEVAPTLKESTPSREEAAPSKLESPPPKVDNAELNTTSMTNLASGLSSPSFQTPHLGERGSHVPPPNPYSSGGDDDKPLYTPRARIPVRSPRLTSVD